MLHLFLQHTNHLKQLHGSPHLLLLLVIAVSASDLLKVLPALIHQHFLKQPHSYLLLPLLYLLRRLLNRVFRRHVRAGKKKFLSLNELLDVLPRISYGVRGGSYYGLLGFPGDSAVKHA
jgi:hypothetical protein